MAVFIALFLALAILSIAFADVTTADIAPAKMVVVKRAPGTAPKGGNWINYQVFSKTDTTCANPGLVVSYPTTGCWAVPGATGGNTLSAASYIVPASTPLPQLFVAINTYTDNLCKTYDAATPTAAAGAVVNPIDYNSCKAIPAALQSTLGDGYFKVTYGAVVVPAYTKAAKGGSASYIVRSLYNTNFGASVCAATKGSATPSDLTALNIRITVPLGTCDFSGSIWTVDGSNELSQLQYTDSTPSNPDSTCAVANAAAGPVSPPTFVAIVNSGVCVTEIYGGLFYGNDGLGRIDAYWPSTSAPSVSAAPTSAKKLRRNLRD